VDADTLRHIDDRSTRIEDEANGLVFVLLGEVSACRHAIPSAAISGSLRPSVYKIGNSLLLILSAFAGWAVAGAIKRQWRQEPTDQALPLIAPVHGANLT
jgi:hypothetical protein